MTLIGHIESVCALVISFLNLILCYLSYKESKQRESTYSKRLFYVHFKILLQMHIYYLFIWKKQIYISFTITLCRFY